MRTNPWTTPCRCLSRSILVLAMMTATGSGATGAEPVPSAVDDDFADLTALNADELQSLRGGFEFAGMIFNFAAQLRTFVDGRLALETLITYTDRGTVAEHRPVPLPNAATQPNPTSTPSSSTAPTSAAGESIQVLGTGQGQTPAQLNLPGIDLSGLKDASGILINDRKGAILALHEATRERITSMVINQANGRDIRQEMNVSVTVENFQQFRDTMRNTILNGRLSATSR